MNNPRNLVQPRLIGVLPASGAIKEIRGRLLKKNNFEQWLGSLEDHDLAPPSQVVDNLGKTLAKFIRAQKPRDEITLPLNF
ncbi:MAG TPA: hypothetical protein VMV04_08195 [Thermodesulfobacteriota bacterium]|nr:hypothetical protein [Thermodesulfobacteriota bacterium]